MLTIYVFLRCSPQWSYDALLKKLKIASVHTIPDAGHFVSSSIQGSRVVTHTLHQVVQENPIGVANVLAEILLKIFDAPLKARM